MDQQSVSSGGALVGNPKAQRELPKVGDVLKFRYHPYDGSSELLEGNALQNGEQITEVEVTGIKKAVVSFE